MDVWLGWHANFLDAVGGFKLRTETPSSGGHFLLTGLGSNAQTGNSDMLYRPGKSTGYVLIANGPEKRKIYVFPCSHYYVHYEEQVKNILTRTLQMKSFSLP